MPRTESHDPGEPGQVGDYRLTERIGQGGQGEVYRAVAPSGTDVAVKILHARLSGDADARRRFFREVELARRVAPFCTARVLDMGLHRERPYIVSEFVAGASLQRVVQRDGPRSGGGLERLAVATATALAAIHRAGIVHRDFKPSNVIMGPEGPVVIDFGISRALDHTVTQTGSMGTPGYMAPEQIATGLVGPAADVFSWAATMIYAATGRPAFPGESVPALLYAIMHSTPDLSGLPEGLRALVAACLSKDPDSRPVAAALVRTLTGDDLPGPSGGNPPGPSIGNPPNPSIGNPPGPSVGNLPGPSGGNPPGPSGGNFAGPSGGGLPRPRPNPSSDGSTVEADDGRTTESSPAPGRRPIPRRALVAAGVATVLVAGALTVQLWPGTDGASTDSSRVTTTLTDAPNTPIGGTSGTSGTPGTTRTPIAAPSSSVPFGAQVGEPLTDHGNDVRSVAVDVLDGAPVAVSGSDDESARVLDLANGKQLGASLSGHTGWVRSVAVGRLDDAPVAVTGSDDDTARIWNLRTGRQIGSALAGHTGDVKAVAVGELDDVPIAITGGADERAHVWNLRTHREYGAPLAGHKGTVWAVAIGELDDSPIAVTTGDDGTVRVWDLTTRKQLGDSLTGHTGWVRSVALGEIDGRPIALTGGEDRTARVWDLTTRKQLGTPLTGHTGWVWSVALGDVEGRPIALTGGEDRTARVWDLTTRKQLGAPLSGHTDCVWTVAFGAVGGLPVAVTGSRDETVRVWSLGPPLPPPRP
ncbi:serine/threonine-protein kinase [Streptosporangium subroseum]|uniref:serine/threonine-protein kinase n=1 Tax=Streptosporangium subroseum TaxID=106412 RepID=UPI00344616A0